MAAAPLFFFENPLALFDAGLSNKFYGIAIWPSSVLAAYGFYRAINFTDRVSAPAIVDASHRTAAVIAVLVAALAFMSQAYRGDYVGLESVRPWNALKIALPIYAGLRALDAIFYQGVWQSRVVPNHSRIVRIVTTSLLPIVVHIGFVIAFVERQVVFRPEELTGYVGGTAVGGVVSAICFELGVPVWGCAVVHAIFGLAFVWFQQGILL